MEDSTLNLFVTDKDPLVAATHLDDIRLNKMIVESCQMIVIALVKNGLPNHLIPLTKAGKPYKTKGHANHPVTIWTGRTEGNFRWHLDYLGAMLIEYNFRTGKNHVGGEIFDLAAHNRNLIPYNGIDSFQNSSKYQETLTQDIFECYRQTMIDKWTTDKIKVKWTKREPPSFAPKMVLIDGVYYKFTESDQTSVDQLLVEVHPQS